MSGQPDERTDFNNKKGTVVVVESTYSPDGQTLKEIILNMLFKIHEI